MTCFIDLTLAEDALKQAADMKFKLQETEREKANVEGLVSDSLYSLRSILFRIVHKEKGVN